MGEDGGLKKDRALAQVILTGDGVGEREKMLG